MKKTLSLVLALFLVITCCACGAQKPAETAAPTAAATEAATEAPATEAPATEAPAAAAEETITIIDHEDREVTLPKHVERIAVCDILPLPSVLTVFFDSAEKIVGMAPSSMTAAQNSLISELYPEILNAETGFMQGSEVNTEELAMLEPDVVFFSARNQKIGDTLRNAGFNAVGISVNKWEYNTIETLNQWISLLSQIFPDNDRTEIVRKNSDEIYDLVQSRTADLKDEDRARVFFLFKYTDSSIMTSGHTFFGQWWADAIGAVNVAQEITKDNAVPVNLEQVYTWNPDVILVTNFTPAQPEDLYNNTAGAYDWSGIDAVVNQRVYKMPLGMYRSYTPGVDTPITLLWLAKTVYPELFEDIDVTQKAIEYYETVFGITLTPEQADSIFNPSVAAGKIDF